MIGQATSALEAVKHALNAVALAETLECPQVTARNTDQPNPSG